MINYSPINGDPSTSPVSYRPKTCFLMTQLGGDIDEGIENIRRDVTVALDQINYSVIDAESAVTGKDFLLKIWEMIVAVPLGVAIIHNTMPTKTLCNIFYELGMAQSLGKETLIIKASGAEIPSDFVRTEYIQYDKHFSRRLEMFLKGLKERKEYYEQAADLLENNPLLSIDYLRRAYLLSGEETYRERTSEIFEQSQLDGRASNSVEALLKRF